MDELTLDGENGRALVLRRLSERGDEAVWAFEATLRIPEAAATTSVYEHGTGLRSFMADLAKEWRGFEGVRSYASLEGELALDATHDGHGTVSCRVSLGSPAPPEWSFEAVLDFGAGAHLERLARAVDTFVP